MGPEDPILPEHYELTEARLDYDVSRWIANLGNLLKTVFREALYVVPCGPFRDNFPVEHLTGKFELSSSTQAIAEEI